MFHVLLPVDPDEERALAAAKTVGNLPGQTDEIEVTVLNVQEKVEVSGSEGGRISSDDWYDAEDFPDSVVSVTDFLEEIGVTVNIRREHAEPAKTIIEVANEIDADRIIMAGRKRSPVGKVLFGSVTQSVLLDADVAVIVVPALKD